MRRQAALAAAAALAGLILASLGCSTWSVPNPFAPSPTPSATLTPNPSATPTLFLTPTRTATPTPTRPATFTPGPSPTPRPVNLDALPEIDGQNAANLKQVGRLGRGSVLGCASGLRVVDQTLLIGTTAGFYLFDQEPLRERYFAPAASRLFDAVPSPDGVFVVTAHLDGSLNVWDAQTGLLLYALRAPTGQPARALAFEASGERLFVADPEQISVWNFKSRAEAGSLPVARAAALAFNPQTHVLAAAFVDGAVQLWQVDSGQQAGALRIPGGEGAVCRLEFSPDGSTLAEGLTGSLQVALFDLNAAAGEDPQILRNAADLAFAPDGRKVVADRRAPYLLPAVGEESLRSLAPSEDHHFIYPAGWAFSADGRLVYSVTNENLAAWDVESGDLVQNEPWSSYDGAVVSFQPAGGLVAVFSPRIDFLDPLAQSLVGSLPADRLAADGSAFAKITAGMITLNSTAEDVVLGRIKTTLGRDESLVIGPRGSEALIFNRGELLPEALFRGQLSVWDVKTGGIIWSLDKLKLSITDAAFSPSGRTLSVLESNQVSIYSVREGKKIAAAGGFDSWAQRAQLSPDDRWLAVGDLSGSLFLYDVENNAMTRLVKGPGMPLAAGEYEGGNLICDLAFSPNGQVLAAGSGDGTVRLLNRETGKTLAQIRAGRTFACSLSFSPDGRLLAASSGDGFITLWGVK